MTRPDEGLSSPAPGGGKMRDLGNKVDWISEEMGKYLFYYMASSVSGQDESNPVL